MPTRGCDAPGVEDLNAVLTYCILLFAVDGDLLRISLRVLLGRVQVLVGRIRLVPKGNSCARSTAQKQQQARL
eukprot:6200080-Pleurochrysis_carterae.AAC.2